ncbi:hypothetical protein BSKO_10381 [Bryopsis sp. KO-2023]|nr:hypothetical protein BSKO_10381 [Bryopsis sp. KO-2023]
MTTNQLPPPPKAGETFRDNTRKGDVRTMNIEAAKAVADAVRTSLGPRGMDKMVSGPDGVLITNDGATIVNKMTVTQPAAKMLVELSKSQDVVAGDGTTSVVVICGALLKRCMELLGKGIHPTIISDSFLKASMKACEILESIAIPVDLNDRESLIRAASTSLSSKVVSQYSSLLSPMAVDCVLRIRDPERPQFLDLKDVKLISKLGGTLEDTEPVDGMVFNQKAMKSANGPTKVQNAKIALIQFCISPPKTDLENNVIVSDYQQMDRILKEERNYILQMIKKIRAAGVNVLLIQKSILRDAVTDLAIHYLAKAKIMVLKDIEREEIEFISKTLGCLPIAHIDHMRPEKLATADLVEEVEAGKSRMVKVSGIHNQGRTATVVLRGSNKLVLEEAERSLHDALCVVRCLVQKSFLIPGGAAPEVEVALQLSQWAKTLEGMEQYCVKAFAEALEVIPFTLAENAGLNPINVMSELRNAHAQGKTHHGINVKKGVISDMLEESVVQPLLVNTSAITLACETVRMIMKIDDIVLTR